jgi:short-subunit dehydrogenase involved in D-alanine esterification of teichoic acids
MSIETQTVVVTGGSQGIGAGLVKAGEVLHVDGGAHIGKW